MSSSSSSDVKQVSDRIAKYIATIETQRAGIGKLLRTISQSERDIREQHLFEKYRAFYNCLFQSIYPVDNDVPETLREADVLKKKQAGLPLQYEIKLKHLLSLRPLAPIADTVVSWLLDGVIRSPRYASLNTQFLNPSFFQLSLASLGRSFRGESRKLPTEGKSLYVFLKNISACHWILFALDVNKRIVYCFDSINSKVPDQDFDDLFDRLNQYANPKQRLAEEIEFDQTEYEMKQVQVPQQALEGNNCGLYTVFNAVDLLDSMLFDTSFSSSYTSATVENPRQRVIALGKILENNTIQWTPALLEIARTVVQTCGEEASLASAGGSASASS